MRLFPATNAACFCLVALTGLVLTASPSAAQTYGGTGATVQPQMSAEGLAEALGQSNRLREAEANRLGGGVISSSPYDAPAPLTQAELDEQLRDKTSAQYKASQLAKQARRDMSLFGAIKAAEPEIAPMDKPVPPPMHTLQAIHSTHGSAPGGISDDLITEEMSLNMRRDAQREAALSYGARGGLAKRSYEMSESLRAYETVLDKVFNFRELLIRAPSGLLIEPPIVRESLDNAVITEEGAEAAVADQVLKINRQARIVTAPREWRQYLTFNYTATIAPPPKVLWPKDSKEQVEWNTWVREGWEAGFAQAEDSFDANLNQLVSDYQGMVRYRMLLAQGKISQPYALHEDRGVTGGGSEMRVGDRALRITGPSQFLTEADLWKPADR